MFVASMIFGTEFVDGTKSYSIDTTIVVVDKMNRIVVKMIGIVDATDSIVDAVFKLKTYTAYVKLTCCP